MGEPPHDVHGSTPPTDAPSSPLPSPRRARLWRWRCCASRAGEPSRRPRCRRPRRRDQSRRHGRQGRSGGVFVRDSALAVEKLALAQKMERLKEWNKSADLYQEILDKYADRVVPSQVDKDNKIYQYTSVVKGVQEQLAKWPQEGRDVTGRYEATAQQMLEKAKRGDLFTLNQIFSRYFITDAAKKAGMRLIDLNLERGEFLAAARMGDQLVERHPR